MKQFALIFRMDILSPEKQPSAEQMEAYMKDWNTWTNQISEGGKLAGGHHFAREGRLLKPGNQLHEKPYSCENISLAGYILVNAASLNEATEMARSCPILNGHNTSVEVRETTKPG